MARIKVTGFLDTDDMDDEHVDLDDPSGLSEAGFEDYTFGNNSQITTLGDLSELDFKLVKGEPSRPPVVRERKPGK